jgi:tRNA(Ile)-lysidine synthase
VAAGHTATDQIETVLYRLAASPGRRALLGIPERSGRLVRPLLAVSREETAAYCAERGLAWREDASNAESKRGRLRTGLVPALRELHPAAEENILRTLALLREEAAVLDAAVDVALGEGAPEIVRLAEMPPALARLAVQRLADRAAQAQGHPAGDPAAGDPAPPGPAVGDRVAEILALGNEGTRSLDLHGGLRAVVTYGRLTIERARAPATPLPTRLAIPGSADYGGGRIAAERGPDIPVGDGTLDAGALAPDLEVRPWRPGDRMRPLGLDGSRSLQDLFTDRKVPRELRSRIPVVVSDGEIAWVPGLATAERFKVTDATTDRVKLSWQSPA